MTGTELVSVAATFALECFREASFAVVAVSAPVFDLRSVALQHCELVQVDPLGRPASIRRHDHVEVRAAERQGLALEDDCKAGLGGVERRLATGWVEAVAVRVLSRCVVDGDVHEHLRDVGCFALDELVCLHAAFRGAEELFERLTEFFRDGMEQLQERLPMILRRSFFPLRVGVRSVGAPTFITLDVGHAFGEE